jgi:hypothetical protein
MWEPRQLATLGASTACNRDIFTFTHCIGGLVGPRPGVRAEKRKIFALSGNRNMAVQPVARRFTDWAIPVPICTLQQRFFQLRHSNVCTTNIPLSEVELWDFDCF